MKKLRKRIAELERRVAALEQADFWPPVYVENLKRWQQTFEPPDPSEQHELRWARYHSTATTLLPRPL